MFRFRLLLCLLAPALSAADPGRNVIFLHVDGTSQTSWMATRYLTVGPAGRLHWDRLPHLAIYDGRLTDALSASSNGGATTHAWGVRADHRAYGFVEPDARALSGYPGPLMREAQAAGRAVAIIQTGAHYEPGTAVFLTSSDKREEPEAISAGVLASGADILLGGGEAWFRPAGASGRHGPGQRRDGRDLVAEAEQAGYQVVFTRDELQAVPARPGVKVLGLFAHNHMFHDRPEEDLRAAGLPFYQAQAPTYAEMLRWTLQAIGRDPRGFFIVAEEEGTDNFANKNNAAGTIEAHRRADEAIGVARAFIGPRDDTLLLVGADSSAAAMTLMGHREDRIPADRPVPARDPNGAPIDGREGTQTLPFLALPDEHGKRLPFWIAWGATDDTSGGVIIRAEGFNAQLVRGNLDNIDLYRLMYLTLFGRELVSPRPAADTAGF